MSKLALLRRVAGVALWAVSPVFFLHSYFKLVPKIIAFVTLAAGWYLSRGKVRATAVWAFAVWTAGIHVMAGIASYEHVFFSNVTEEFTGGIVVHLIFFGVYAFLYSALKRLEAPPPPPPVAPLEKLKKKKKNKSG
jgi:hypothetical protein